MLTERDLERLRLENAVAALQARCERAEKEVARLTAVNESLRKAVRQAVKEPDDEPG